MNHVFAAKQIFYIVFSLGVILLGTVGCSCYKNDSIDNATFYGTNISALQEKSLIAQKTYHFGLDKYDVSNETDVLSIYSHAKRIISAPKVKIRIEGHTDERGSNEYNVALGERRAKAIESLLLIKGVDPSQINIVSYGKQKPIASGHDEYAWKLNRRATIVYEQK